MALMLGGLFIRALQFIRGKNTGGGDSSGGGDQPQLCYVTTTKLIARCRNG